MLVSLEGIRLKKDLWFTLLVTDNKEALKKTKYEVLSDSKLMVIQIPGEYKAKESNMITLSVEGRLT